MDKNDLRELLYKLFNKYEKEKSVKIKEYLMNEKIHYYFLILLSKLRTNNKCKQSKILIDFLGELLNIILDVSEKNKIYNNAKNCIILSQTFYYEQNEEKIYLLEKIRNHKWLKSLDFWINFGDITIQPELEKLIEKYSDITIEDILNHNNEKITTNLMKKISEVIFAQILPFVNNIKEFGINLKVIIEITENFLHKYDYLDEEEKNNIFNLISDNQDEINQIREKYKNEIQLKEKEEQEEKEQDKNEELSQIKEKNIEINKKINSININNKPNKENENIDNEKKNKIKEKENNPTSDKENKTNEKENKNKEKENKLKENEDKLNEKEASGKGFLGIFKKKDKDKEKKNEKEKEKEIKQDNNEEKLLQRSITVSLATNLTLPKEKKKGGVLFKNFKNIFSNKQKKIKENKDIEEKKEEEKKEIKETEKNIETKKENKIPPENKMIKIDFNTNKLQSLKPIPKVPDNNTKNNENKNNPGNPFGVVLKKIDKGKKYI